MSYTREQIAGALDYAVLKSTASIEDVKDGCAFANKHKLKSVCVASANTSIAASCHDNVSVVIGYPLGNVSAVAKYYEAMYAVMAGAKELDVVINFGRFLGGDPSPMNDELILICELAREHDVLVKAILEACFYTAFQLREACKRCADAGVHFVKTSTGLVGGATVGDVIVMVDALKGTGVGVKASGGIKTYEDAKRFLDLGCTRLGASRYLELLPS